VTRVAPLLLAALLLAGACRGDDGNGGASPAGPSEGSATVPAPPQTLPPPAVPAGDLDPEVVDAIDQLFDGIGFGIYGSRLDVIVASGDPRVSWLLADLLYFYQDTGEGEVLADGIAELTGAPPDPVAPWRSAVDQLLAWDLPAPPGYADWKRDLLLRVEDRWEPLLGEDADLDWRVVSWGGVRIDDRPLDDNGLCIRGCIPALDDPGVTTAAEGHWYPDDGLVFGVVVDGEARAYPRHIMEVHEMVMDTVGGRPIGVPYCTLCGSAQAYLLDELPDGFEQPVLRTSGLLSRSNKVMYDLVSWSLIDTFTGRATSGPLAEAAVTLPMVSVVTATWGEWRQAHPDTTIVAQDGGIGRSYPADPLRGRDDDGPIFPIGAADPRLDVHEPVLGVVTASGQPVAFPVARAAAHLLAGGEITVDGVRIELDGGGLRAVRADGADPGAHQAFWFAWSQFHPDTGLWPDDVAG
jgi:hypothetical protein